MPTNDLNQEYLSLFHLLTKQQKRMIINLLKTIIPKEKQEALKK